MLFFYGYLNGRTFLKCLKHDLWFLLDYQLLSIRPSIWFQIDDAPLRLSDMMRNYLNRKFSKKWLGRGGSSEWPARSRVMSKISWTVILP